MDKCFALLGMKDVGTHREELRMYSSEALLLPEVKIPLLASQVTGVVHAFAHLRPLSIKQQDLVGFASRPHP